MAKAFTYAMTQRQRYRNLIRPDQRNDLYFTHQRLYKIIHEMDKKNVGTTMEVLEKNFKMVSLENPNINNN